MAFCQTEYEAGLRSFFHNQLEMREPRYEYEFPEPYVKPWKSFYVDQIDKGFNEFLDRHRDPKDIERQVLESKLANTSPFTGDRYCNCTSAQLNNCTIAQLHNHSWKKTTKPIVSNFVV